MAANASARNPILGPAWRGRMCDRKEDNGPAIEDYAVKAGDVHSVDKVIGYIVEAINVNPNAYGAVTLDAGSNMLFDGSPLLSSDVLVPLLLMMTNSVLDDAAGTSVYTLPRAAATAQFVVACICKCKLDKESTCTPESLAADIRRGVEQYSDIGVPQHRPDMLALVNQVTAANATHNRCVRFVHLQQSDVVRATPTNGRTPVIQLYLDRYRIHYFYLTPAPPVRKVRFVNMNGDYNINKCASIIMTIFLHYVYAAAISGAGSDQELIELLKSFEPPDEQMSDVEVKPPQDGDDKQQKKESRNANTQTPHARTTDETSDPPPVPKSLPPIADIRTVDTQTDADPKPTEDRGTMTDPSEIRVWSVKVFENTHGPPTQPDPVILPDPKPKLKTEVPPPRQDLLEYKSLSEQNLRIVPPIVPAVPIMPLLGPMTNADRARRNPRNPSQLITRSTLAFNMMACLSNPASMKLNVALDLAWRHRQLVKKCVTEFVVATVKKHLYTMPDSKKDARFNNKVAVFADLATISGYVGLDFKEVVTKYAKQMRVTNDAVVSSLLATINSP